MTTVLVVDDVPAMAEQYAYDLKRVGGYDALVASGGREALDTLEREAVDCVILDLEMPGMDGFEVLRAMERRSFRVPVIVYTGTGNYDRCTQAIRLGAQSFIDKAEPMSGSCRRSRTRSRDSAWSVKSPPCVSAPAPTPRWWARAPPCNGSRTRSRGSPRFRARC